MGYYHTLRFVAIIKPEYIQYMIDDTFRYNKQWYYLNEDDVELIPEEYKHISKEQRDLIIAIHSSRLIGDNGFYPKMDGDKCIYETSIKITRYTENLEEDFKLFMVNVIAPISTTIIHCEIIEEPFAGPDIINYYTDAEVREFNTEPSIIDRGKKTISNKDYKSYFG
jgi:hypothetical protein